MQEHGLTEICSESLINYVNILLFDKWQENNLAIVPEKLNEYLVAHLWPSIKHSHEVLLSDGMRSDACTRLINKFKSLVVADLVATNHTELTQLQAKVNFLVDFVAYIVKSFFNVEYFAALLAFIGNYMVIFKLPVLETVK